MPVPALASARAALPGLGTPAALALLVPMEAGVPIPVPADLLMLLVGERVAAGAVPIWIAVLAFEAVALVGTTILFVVCRKAGRAAVSRIGARAGLTEARLARATAVVEQRGRVALAVGRGTPGLRTVTVVAAGGSGVSTWRALPALAAGSSVFLQLHLVLGLLVGPAAARALRAAQGPALAVLAVSVLVAVVLWLVRRGRRAGVQAWTEAACPACLALSALAGHQSDLAELGGRTRRARRGGWARRRVPHRRHGLRPGTRRPPSP